MFKKILAIKEELLSFSISQRWFIFCVMLCGFCISAEYAVIRPISGVVLISSYSANILPYVWFATVPLNLLVVGLYNRYLPKIGVLPMFYIISSLVVLMSTASSFFMADFPPLAFLYYAWKEIYVLLMFQQIWSMIHTTIPSAKAKYLFGVIFGFGGVGAVIGSVFPSFFAVSFGSERLLLLTIPIYALFIIAFTKAYKKSSIQKQEVQKPSFFEGFKLIGKSKILTYLLMTVLFMQIASAIVDFQFNYLLERSIFDKDLRTEYCGRVYGIVSMITTALQFVGTFLVVHFLGMQRSHLFVPATLLSHAVGFLLFPMFGMISYAYVSIKALDFSVFGVIREMLYIPLKQEEKFQAKSVIDVFVHRSAKAFASLIIVFLQIFGGENILSILSVGLFSIFLAWLVLVVQMIRAKQLAN